MNLKHLFFPHPQTHRKAHLLSPSALLIYVLLFMLLQVNIGNISHFKPGVLGISSNIDVESLISLTNSERAKNGLPALKENTELDSAAQAKGENMFAEDYWAHFAPSGKSPWDFIQAAGYKFSYAGENLARNFYTSPDVVTAWMNSPSHRENILNPHYEDIGMAVLQGTLQGQQTTLVVQEFGSPPNYVAAAPAPQIPTQGVSNAAPESQNVLPSSLGESSQKPAFLVDPYALEKNFGLIILLIILSLTLVDIVIMQRRGLLKISARHLPHLAMLCIGITALLVINPGGIL